MNPEIVQIEANRIADFFVPHLSTSMPPKIKASNAAKL